MSGARTARAWTFRGLVLVGMGWLLYSWFLPWWSMDIAQLGPDRVIVRPWGEEANLGAWQMVFDMPQLPAFFEPFAWTYLGVCVVLLILSLLVKDKIIKLGRFTASLPQAIVGAVGIAYIAVPAIATLAIMINLSMFEVDGVTVPLQGTVHLDFGQPWASDVTSRLRLGYWLAWGAGAFLILMALMRDKIVGKGHGEHSSNQ